MIHAYSENYLSRAIVVTSEIFDLAVNVVGVPLEEFVVKFVESPVAKSIETASPLICAKSGIELCEEVTGKKIEIVSYPESRSPEYWLGWILAFCQWSLDVSFASLNDAIPFSELIKKYPVLHEAPREKILELYEKKIRPISKLKKTRESKSLSQSELSKLSGVKLRNIQAYEQGELSIEKASVENAVRLSRALGCKVEDLV